MVKKILFSLFLGLVILIVTWYYQNYDYSFSMEDAFFKKMAFWKYKILDVKPKNYKEFVFINTSKDPAIVADTLEYGNVVVSDREMISKFVTGINRLPGKPAFTVLDIQFYYPFTVNPAVDSAMQSELNKNSQIVFPVVKNEENEYFFPLYKGLYGYSDYRTFGAAFNKFRLQKSESIPSIPVVLHQKVDGAVYEDHFYYTKCNGRLSLSAIWPTYFLRDSNVVGNRNKYSKYFNIGEILLDMEANPDNYQNYFKDKIVVVGNFESDVHPTAVGKMSGPILLANMYLSLVNNQHLTNIWMFLVIWLSFSALSYVAFYKKMPEIKMNLKFMFSSFITKFVKTYFSYFGSMFVLSAICLFVFNIQIALFLPALIFSGLENWRQKKKKKQEAKS